MLAHYTTHLCCYHYRATTLVVLTVGLSLLIGAWKPQEENNGHL